MTKTNTYDAIVIGSGISGGWAAKELCEAGMKTLVLERGRDVKHVQDYPTAMTDPWDLPHRGRIPLADITENPIVKRCYAYDEATQHFFVKDKEHPYVQEKPYDWIRGYQVGGKSLIWARQTQGETIPRHENHVRLSSALKDAWGIPQLVTSIGYEENDVKMMKDFHNQATEMLEKAGCKNVNMSDSHQNPGLDIHEMGGVRMGKDPKTSLLNSFNQLYSCKNVFVTDGACMTSVGNQNPSLTFMALTARAVNHAVGEIRKKNL